MHHYQLLFLAFSQSRGYSLTSPFMLDFFCFAVDSKCTTCQFTLLPLLTLPFAILSYSVEIIAIAVISVSLIASVYVSNSATVEASHL